ncbi:acyl-CoA N-acyltransferase [Trichoderma citrinoviride]|uniref:Acyl-CoA N-acyltransferase n=1 Tax=Trichoderma citrinoviride TaxID=58853 RepID=A0A2T4BEG9_9HYPO|nr:acyl-CoA N-acyltransferase [Trichoderma citrinoviride]PTB67730.1 acyl-CoA N-acyltransferase [Trichoderma citrinoviride]
MGSTKEPDFIISTVTDASTVEKHLTSLRVLLQHCINDEPEISSLGFLAPLTDHTATSYWLDLLSSSVIGPGATTTLLVATAPGSDQVIATVQLARMSKETHAFKGEVRKLMVHPDYRRHGLGRRMMDEVERVAKEEFGMEMLLLDTSKETPARQFYLRTGWTEWGICPDYAKSSSGHKHDCCFFCKSLA